jgi:hypothetical protein
MVGMCPPLSTPKNPPMVIFYILFFYFYFYCFHFLIMPSLSHDYVPLSQLQPYYALS